MCSNTHSCCSRHFNAPFLVNFQCDATKSPSMSDHASLLPQDHQHAHLAAAAGRPEQRDAVQAVRRGLRGRRRSAPVPGKVPRPADFLATFAGNTDDAFRIGLQVGGDAGLERVVGMFDCWREGWSVDGRCYSCSGHERDVWL